MFVLTVRIDHEDPLDESVAEGEVSLGLSFSHSHQREWVFCNEVLQANSNLAEVLKSEASIDIILVSSNDKHHLRKKFPKLGRNSNVPTTGIVDEDIDAIKTIFNRIEPVWRQRVHKYGVNDWQDLGEARLVLVHCLKDSSDGSDATCSCESSLLLLIGILSSVIFDQFGVLFGQLLCKLNRVWSNIVLENLNNRLKGRHQLL